jgi:hypothetical protein
MRAFGSLLATAALVAGCGGGGGGTGTLDLSVTDAPVDGATAVVVQFDQVEIKPAAGPSQLFDAPGQIDLLSLQNGTAASLLQGVTVAAGNYNWIRLHVSDEAGASYIRLQATGDAQHPLTVPSGAETGLKLNRGFSVPENGVVAFTIDFDLRKSVHEANGNYLLRPTLRIVQDELAGAISGTVANTFDVAGQTPAESACAAYVYAGSDVMADDEGSAAPPVASGQLSLDAGSGDYSYTVAFLEPGAYTVALTCAAAADLPDQDDDIAFGPTQNAGVVAGAAATVDFP